MTPPTALQSAPDADAPVAAAPPRADVPPRAVAAAAPVELADAARLRLYETVLQATPDLVYVFDLQHRFIYANQALLDMWGRSEADALGKTCLEIGYEPWHAAMHDEEIETVVATRAPIRGDVPFPHQTLGVRIYDYIFMPVIGPDGRVEAVAGMTRDVTDRRAHEEAQRRSEQRLSTMANASADLLYRMNPDWTEAAIVGGRAVDRLARGPQPVRYQDRIHPDDRPAVADAVAKAIAAGAPYAFEHRLSVGADEWAWIESHAVPIRDDAGEVVEWFGSATDITERVRHEQHLRLLVHELNHRVKNTLGIVQSMVLQTLRSCDDPRLAGERIESRLLALAKAHDLLTRHNWEDADVGELVRTAVAHCIDDEGRRLAIDGPAVVLDPRRAVALSMALHELCTNALKYGALSVPGGSVRTHWRVDGDGDRARLRLAWQERGGPRVVPPAHRGFGSRLVERGLRHDLDGDVRLLFSPGGVECHIDAPLHRATR